MTTETIPRISARKDDDWTIDERQQLAIDAQSLLKYDKLAKALTLPGALMFTLRKLEIEPLVPGKVKQYRQRKARPGMWGSRKKGYTFLAIAAAAVSGAELLNHFTDWSAPSLNAITVVVLAIVTIVFLIAGMTWLFEAPSGARIIRFWSEVNIAEFSGNIPEFALRKAVQIKQALPATVFSVEFLCEKSEAVQRRLPDPFLIARLGDERYYIDVWDEEEYEASI